MKTFIVVLLVIAIAAAAGFFLFKETRGKFPEPQRVEISMPNPDF